MVYIKPGKHLSTPSDKRLGISEEGGRLQGTGDSFLLPVTFSLSPSSSRN